MTDMVAGRELDALVAEKVMGLTMAPELDIAQYKRYRPYPVEDRGMFAEVPHYSADIAAAWLVVEKMKCYQRSTYFSYDHISETWQVGFGPDWANAGTAPLAICLAALKTASMEV